MSKGSFDSNNGFNASGDVVLKAGKTIKNSSGARLVANIAAIATADGSDAATTQALANANKAKINALLAALKAGGIMVADA